MQYYLSHHLCKRAQRTSFITLNILNGTNRPVRGEGDWLRRRRRRRRQRCDQNRSSCRHLKQKDFIILAPTVWLHLLTNKPKTVWFKESYFFISPSLRWQKKIVIVWCQCAQIEIKLTLAVLPGAITSLNSKWQKLARYRSQCFNTNSGTIPAHLYNVD